MPITVSDTSYALYHRIDTPIWFAFWLIFALFLIEYVGNINWILPVAYNSTDLDIEHRPQRDYVENINELSPEQNENESAHYRCRIVLVFG